MIFVFLLYLKRLSVIKVVNGGERIGRTGINQNGFAGYGLQKARHSLLIKKNPKYNHGRS